MRTIAAKSDPPEICTNCMEGWKKDLPAWVACIVAKVESLHHGSVTVIVNEGVPKRYECLEREQLP